MLRAIQRRVVHTIFLNSVRKFFCVNFTVLVEVSQLSNFVPQVSHDLLVLFESSLIPVTLALDDGVADGQAFKIAFVQGTVSVNVVHVPDDELYAVIPRVSHCFSNLLFVLIEPETITTVDD